MYQNLYKININVYNLYKININAYNLYQQVTEIKLKHFFFKLFRFKKEFFTIFYT